MVQLLVPLTVGLLATAGVIATLWQRQRSEQVDRRHRLEYEARVEWWRRFAWAADKTVSEDEDARLLGVSIVSALAESPLLTESERGIVEAVTLEIEGQG